MKPRSPRERLALILLAAIACWCGSAPGSWADPTPAAQSALTRGSLRLLGRFSAAHACVLGPRQALTNGHVIDQRPFDNSVPAFPYAYSDGVGGSGFLVPTQGGLERARDLATVEPLGTGIFAHYLPIAQAAPKPGDRIFLLGYDWSNRKNAMADDVIEAKVVRVVALHVLFFPSGKPGSSGSCVVNEAGEVVAINEGGYSLDDGNDIGLSVGVWGSLSAMPKE